MAKQNTVPRKKASSRTRVPESEPVAAGTKPGTKVRLQKALAAAGYGSRRQCEGLIVEGRVIVDGNVVSELGVTVEPSAQKIFVDGTALKPRRLVYYALNKPTGIVTTNDDPEGRPRVIDLVPPDERVFPVGRLDRSSEGLILLTNDGELAQRLAHPRYEICKVYRVVVAGKIAAETLSQMEKGIYIAEGVVRVEGAKILKTRGQSTELEITLKEGKNREIRRILARLGHKVQQLKRIAIGPLRLGEMPTGAHRRLSLEELKKLKAAVDPANKANVAEGVAARSARRATGKSPKKHGPGPGSLHASRTAKTGVKKTSAKPFAARAAGDAQRSGESRPTSNRRPLPKRKAEIDIKVDRVMTGSVIGADPAAKPKPQEPGMRPERKTPRKKVSTKKTSTTRSFGRDKKGKRSPKR